VRGEAAVVEVELRTTLRKVEDNSHHRDIRIDREASAISSGLNSRSRKVKVKMAKNEVVRRKHAVL